MLPEEKAPVIHRLRTTCGNLNTVDHMVEAVNLSQATFRKIKQNLFWAFFYNIAMIPLAVIGWMHPVLAEIAMATSSITVVSNANRLRKVDIRPDYVRDGISEKAFETIQQPVEANV